MYCALLNSFVELGRIYIISYIDKPKYILLTWDDREFDINHEEYLKLIDFLKKENFYFEKKRYDDLNGKKYVTQVWTNKKVYEEKN